MEDYTSSPRTPVPTSPSSSSAVGYAAKSKDQARFGGKMTRLPRKSSGLIKGSRDKINELIDKYNTTDNSVEKRKYLLAIQKLRLDWLEKVKKKKRKADSKKKAEKSNLLSLKLGEIASLGKMEAGELSWMDGTRVQNRGNDGELFTDMPKLNDLKNFILQVKDEITAGRFRAAYTSLMDNANEARFGLTLYKRRAGGNPLKDAQSNRFFGTDDGSPSQRPDTIMYQPLRDLSWLEDPQNAADARKIALMALEEYMHFYQAKSNQFFSPSMKDFKQAGVVLDSATSSSTRGADFDEIDVFAAYADWGFDVEGIDYFSDYDERRTYWAWRQSQT